MSRPRPSHRCQPLVSALLCALLLGSWLPAQAAPIPPEWHPDDYPSRAASAWYGVEVAHFPSRILAEGVERALISNGWGPVLLLDGDDGSCRVVVGEVTRVADAWYLKKELAAQRLADGRVVELPLPRDGRPAAGFNTAPLLEPFTPTDGRGLPGEMTAEEARRRLRTLALEIDGDAPAGEDVPADAADQLVLAFLDAWQSGDWDEETAGSGAVIAARRLWSNHSEPDLALHIAARVARGEWAAPPEKVEEARLLAARLLYAHRRDWRGAWAAVRLMEGERTRPLASRLDDRLRQAALLVELHDRAGDPRPTLAQVRQHLRRTQEMIPADGHGETARSLQLVYLQTFAWEGNWGRVEELTRAWLKRHDTEPSPSGQALLARYFLARSLERHEAWDEAQELLASIVTANVDPAKRLRLGLTTRDIALEARQLQQRFREESRRGEGTGIEGGGEPGADGPIDP